MYFRNDLLIGIPLSRPPPFVRSITFVVVFGKNIVLFAIPRFTLAVTATRLTGVQRVFGHTFRQVELTIPNTIPPFALAGAGTINAVVFQRLTFADPRSACDARTCAISDTFSIIITTFPGRLGIVCGNTAPGRFTVTVS